MSTHLRGAIRGSGTRTSSDTQGQRPRPAGRGRQPSTYVLPRSVAADEDRGQLASRHLVRRVDLGIARISDLPIMCRVPVIPVQLLGVDAIRAIEVTLGGLLAEPALPRPVDPLVAGRDGPLRGDRRLGVDLPDRG